MAKKKKEASYVVVPVEDHEPAPMTSEMVQEAAPEAHEKCQSDLDKHPKFSKFKGEEK